MSCRVDRLALPAWCDQHLASPHSPDFFASRVWYETVLAHALPAGAEPWLARCGPAACLLLPLLRQKGRIGGLVTPYSLEWRPLPAVGADPAALHAAGRELARLLARRAPTRLEAMPADAPGLEPVMAGLRAEGMAFGRYRHFGNWHQPLRADWQGYLADRPSALRSTIQRRTAAMLRRCHFTLHTAPGPDLEEATRAYVTVRDQSWKPPEPFPDFDAALLRATAAMGALRLGLLRDAQGQPIAAQYWVLTGGRAMLLKLAHLREEKAGSPGTVLTALMIRHLIEQDAATELDFGRGDDAYKQLWCSQRRQRIGLVLSDPWHPAGMLQIARQAAQRGRNFLLGRVDA